jgi:Mrp family chromosome partitioning ATPase
MTSLYTALEVEETSVTEIHPPLPSTSFVSESHYAQIVTVTSVHSQEGVTTSVLLLASAILVSAVTNLRVCIVDMNMRNHNAFYHTQQSELQFISLSDNDTIDQDLIQSTRLTTVEGFDCFALFGDAEPYSNHEEEKLQQLLIALSGCYDIIFLDTSAYMLEDPYTLMALKEAEISLCISPCDDESLSAAAAVLSEITTSIPAGGLGINPATVGVLLNQNKLDLLSIYRLTEKLRTMVPIVGALPMIAGSMKKDFREDLPPSLTLVLKNVFVDHEFA